MLQHRKLHIMTLPEKNKKPHVSRVLTIGVRLYACVLNEIILNIQFHWIYFIIPPHILNTQLELKSIREGSLDVKIFIAFFFLI